VEKKTINPVTGKGFLFEGTLYQGDLTEMQAFHIAMCNKIKEELADTQYLIDFKELIGVNSESDPEKRIPIEVLRRYREFLHTWIRRIQNFEYTKKLTTPE